MLMRSLLFVPGNQPDRIDKAVASNADIVIIDLEDAVAISEKEKARKIIRQKLKLHHDRSVMVRVNAMDSDLTKDDLNGIVVSDLAMIMLPKVESPEDLKNFDRLLSEAETGQGLNVGSIGVIALIETALGIENAYAIASGKSDVPRLETLAFGAADYTLDMGTHLSKSGEELAFARSRMAIGCRAAKIPQPIDTPYMVDLKDDRAFEADARRGKTLGFGGKLCIHPKQVDFCNRLFSPTDSEIQFAKKVVDAFEKSEATGKAAIQVDGKFVDYPVVEKAKRIIELSKKIELNR